MHVDAFAARSGAYKVDFSSLQLSYINLIAQAYEVLIDDILYHFLNVSFTCSSGDSISDAIVFEIKLIVGFKDAFAVDIIAVHLVQDISFAKEGDVIDDSRGRYRFAL